MGINTWLKHKNPGPIHGWRTAREIPFPLLPFPLVCPILCAPSTSFHPCLGDTSLGTPGHKDLLRAATSLGTQRCCEQSPAPMSEMPFSVFECSGWPEPAPFPCYHGNGCLGNVCTGCSRVQPGKGLCGQCRAGMATPLSSSSCSQRARPEPTACGRNRERRELHLPVSVLCVHVPMANVPRQLSPQLQERGWQQHGRELLVIHLHM